MAEFPSWQQGLRRSFPPLTGALQTDVAVFGGGLTGVTTALFLQEQGLRTVLIEADILGHGASFGCAGLLTCHGLPGYRQAAEAIGQDAARAFALLMQESVRGVANLVRRLCISCALTETSVYA